MQESLVSDMKAMSVGSEILSKRQFPKFVAERNSLFDRLKAEYDLWVEKQPKTAIKVTFPDGKGFDAHSWSTTPFALLEQVNKSLADKAVIAKVNGELWDLERPFEGDCSLQILTFDDDEGQQVFWHSSAHVLGEAMEGHYKGCLCYGPPIESGFYYDMFMDDTQVSSKDFPELEKFCTDVVKDKQNFVRLEVSKKHLREMFKYNKFKLRIIDEKVTTEKTTVYKCGPLVDLCKGPHVRHTGLIKALALTKNSATYWEGKTECESLQRIYGISFPNKKQLSEWKKFQEEAIKRDHRKLGQEHELFFFNDFSPGSCFFLPKGAILYNNLVDYIKSEYRKRGFTEVISPNIFNTKLWEISGHLEHYADNLFTIEIEKEKYGLKPMNCPGHCIMYLHRTRSWKELPMRYADFGVLHRNELSGALSGLTRVRRFCQDDAHIFCMLSQVKEEIEGCLDFLKSVYSVFGFTMKLNLSTRPETYLGNLEIWDRAEKELAEALDKNGENWVLNPGDGAFYGPKIDIQIQDALKRYHQCATIQLDFNLPERFKLSYVGTDGSPKTPVMIHRAILGSVERFIAILTENFAGKWPFWISPNQAVVVPVDPKYNDYANTVRDYFVAAGFNVDVSIDESLTLNKKVRNAQLSQVNFIFVVGEKEESNKTVNVRTRGNKVIGEKSFDQVIKQFEMLIKTKALDNEADFQ